LRQPTPFGKYLLLDRISVGGMAEVFRAKSYGVEGFERLLAIKRILPSMGEDKDFISMFVDEAKIAGQLSHPNIGQIFELGRAQDSHYIAMEYIWGKDLLQILNRCRKRGEVMPIGLACFVVAKVAEGLDYAHKKRDPHGTPLEIVHRDCSPQNVLVSYEGEVKIIDFGIARAASRSSRTNAGVLKGKFGYMSPEQVRGLPLDHRSDIFALGTVFYEALTGDRLFQGESDFSTLEKVRNAEIRPPRELRSDIPPEIERIVLRALARDPRQRYASCGEMLGDLMRFLTGQNVVFTAKLLGDWIRTMFAEDLEREMRTMEGYRHLGRDGELAATAPQPRASSQPGQARRRDPVDFEEERPTEVLGEIDIASIGAGLRPPPAEPPRVEPAAVVVPGGLALASTEELPRSMLDAAVTSGVAQGGPVAARGSAPGFEPAPEPADPSLAAYGATPVGSSPGAMPPMRYEPTGSSRAVVGQRGRWRRGLGKEIVIAISIASMVLGTIVIVRFALVDRTPRPRATAAPASTGTIAVIIGDELPAQVEVDGKPAGVTTGREPLTLNQQAPGPHAIRVSRAGAPPCERTAEVAAGQIAVVSCALVAPSIGRLVLTGLGAQHVVHVDGQEISPEAAREPILLTPGHRHSITVSVDGREIDRVELALAAGQVQEHAVKAAPLEAGERPESTPETKPEKLEASKPEKLEPPSPAKPEPPSPAKPERPARTERAPVKDAAADIAADVGHLVAFTRPFARIYIDGRDTGRSTPIHERAAFKLSAGKHVVTFVLGEKRVEIPVEIKPGETAKIVKDLNAIN
jgi:serine/threonine protein kinase